MTESEQLVHALGMKAYAAGVKRQSNPFADAHTTFEIKLCHAWFSGWEGAKRATDQIEGRE